MKMPIKLGRKWSPMSVPQSAPEMSSEMHYPTAHIDTEKDLKLPDSGTMTVRYAICREAHEMHPKESHSVAIDLLEIMDVKADKSEKDEDSGEVLDKLREESESYHHDED